MLRTSIPCFRAFAARRSVAVRPGAPSSRLAAPPGPKLAAGGGGKGNGGNTRLCATGGSGPADDGKPGGLWAKYLELLDSHPLITRAMTCGILNGIGDIFSQLVVEQQQLQVQRAVTFTALGLAYVGPVLFFWYGLLGRVIPGTGLASVLGALALDQFAFAPLFIASFITILTSIEGKPEMVRAKLQQDLVPAVKVNWMLWIPAQFINFKFVPPNLRVLAVNITALVWNVYMSYQSHKSVA